MKLARFRQVWRGVFVLAVLIAVSGCTNLMYPAPAADWSSSRDLAAAVRDRLAEDDVVGDLPIGVTVRDGIIVLRGLVPDETTRARVIGIALSTPGVVQVEDELSLW